MIFQIVACAKRASGSLNQNHVNEIICIRQFNGAGNFAWHFPRYRIQPLGPVECDGRDTIDDLVCYRVKIHDTCLWPVRTMNLSVYNYK